MNIAVSQVQVFDAGSSQNGTEIPTIIGQFPFGGCGDSKGASSAMAQNILPILYVTPAYPKFLEGISLFKLDPDEGLTRYRSNLIKLGFSMAASQTKLAFAYTVDSLPTDTFSNEYGATFLAKMADVVSESASDLAQMSGGKTATDIVNQLGTALTENKESKVLSMLGGKVTEIADYAKNLNNLNTSSPFINQMGALANRMLAGQRIDFPSVWKNSTYQPTYSINIKLYNPNPSSKIATEKYIVAPLAAILALVCPSIDDSAGAQGETYSYPLFCKIRANGLFSLENAGITAVQITKGGAEGLVAYNNRVGLVDVRIDFQNLYNTMVIGSSQTDRPVVKDFLDTLIASGETKSFPSGSSTAGGAAGSNYEYHPVPASPTQVSPPTTTQPRVSSDAVNTEKKIEGETPPGSYVPKYPINIDDKNAQWTNPSPSTTTQVASQPESITGFPVKPADKTPAPPAPSFFSWPTPSSVKATAS